MHRRASSTYAVPSCLLSWRLRMCTVPPWCLIPSRLRVFKGYYCPTAGTVEPSLLCSPGFVCRAGTQFPSETCAPGYFCPNGSAVPSPCVAGTFQSIPGQSACNPCPAGACLRGIVISSLRSSTDSRVRSTRSVPSHSQAWLGCCGATLVHNVTTGSFVASFIACGLQVARRRGCCPYGGSS